MTYPQARVIPTAVHGGGHNGGTADLSKTVTIPTGTVAGDMLLLITSVTTQVSASDDNSIGVSSGAPAGDVTNTNVDPTVAVWSDPIVDEITDRTSFGRKSRLVIRTRIAGAAEPNVTVVADSTGAGSALNNSTASGCGFAAVIIAIRDHGGLTGNITTAERITTGTLTPTGNTPEDPQSLTVGVVAGTIISASTPNGYTLQQLTTSAPRIYWASKQTGAGQVVPFTVNQIAGAANGGGHIAALFAFAGAPDEPAAYPWRLGRQGFGPRAGGLI